MRIRETSCLALLAAVAASAVMASGAAAAPKTLTLLQGGLAQPMLVGEEVSLRTKGAVTFETSSGKTATGTITCLPEKSTQGFEGVLLSNGASAATIELTEAFGGIGAAGSTCATTTVLGATAKVDIHATGSLGTLSLGANGKASFAAAPAGPVQVGVSFSGGALCTYDYTKLTGSLSLPAKIVTTGFSKQKLKLEKVGSNVLCPKGAAFTALFETLASEENLTAEGEIS
jgi:hypothetical protein